MENQMPDAGVQHSVSRKRKYQSQGLGFPPLPLMLRLGEDFAEDIVSSFDLFDVIDEEGEFCAALLRRLQQAMAALHHESSRASDDWTRVQCAYKLYCDGFRACVLEYFPTGAYELRFYPLAAVGPDSPLVLQGSSRWNASSRSASGGDSFASYSALIRAYALEHAGYSVE